MGIEIERKFLVNNHEWVLGSQSKVSRILQGYLIQDDNFVLRVRTERISNTAWHGWVTIKSRNPGMTRDEFEWEIPYEEANNLYERCPHKLTKDRFYIAVPKLWTVDVFGGDNAGLMLAEIELDSEDEVVTIPDWVGKEVTDDPKYYNANLAEHPYTSW